MNRDSVFGYSQASRTDRAGGGLVRGGGAGLVGGLRGGNQGRLARAVREHGLTHRQVVELVDRYLRADSAAGIEELLADPLRFCDGSRPEVAGGRTEQAVDPRLSADGARVHRQMQHLQRSGEGLCRVLPAGGGGLSDDDCAVLGEHARAAMATTAAALQRLRGLPRADGQQRDA